MRHHSKLDQLKQMTTVVADTGDVNAIRALKPHDCTTNPSLILKALQMPAFEEMVAKEIEAGRSAGKTPLEIADTLTVGVGVELAQLVPGRVSTEVDARLSFDTEASLAKARALVAAPSVNCPAAAQSLMTATTPTRRRSTRR